MDAPAAPPPVPEPPAPATDKAQANERLLNMLCHLLALSGYVAPVPFANILGPLILWQVKKADVPGVDVHGKESVNFQITMTIATAVAALLCFVLIGFLLLPAVLIYNLVMVIIAGVKANNGEPFQYPLCLRFIK